VRCLGRIIRQLRPRRPSHDGRNSLEAFKTPGWRFPFFNSSGDTPMVPRTVVPHTVVSHNALQVESKRWIEQTGRQIYRSAWNNTATESVRTNLGIGLGGR
jgi:hypothetical protein